MRAFREVQCPAYVDNDVNLAMGERWAGLGRDVDGFLFVKIGRDWRSIVCNGKLYRRDKGCAGDIGHIAVNHADSICS